ncbi:MAG: ATP-dependent helicase [Phycisphaerales bacterium]|nr:ATP-dependent helicase [Planctomycetota bacterium]
MLIEPADFVGRLQASIPLQFGARPPNPRQLECIEAPLQAPLFIVAGPGTGKTTVLVLRALRMVFVEGLLPEQLLITTFTRKAAEELRSRLLTWGMQLQESLVAQPPAHWQAQHRVRSNALDLNRFVTGTLDSVCEDLLSRAREPGEITPALIDGFVADALLLRHAVYPSGAYADGAIDPDLAAYLAQFNWQQEAPTNVGELVKLVRLVSDRLTHDLADVTHFAGSSAHSNARHRLADVHDRYRRHLAAEYRLDFSTLEHTFFTRLAAGRLDRVLHGIAAVLVDEYQDTNPLQEQIYFTLADRLGASLTIVGDDDQSLYRFRGATVEIFRDFVARWTAAGGATPSVKFLIDNYRSTPEIVAFFNDFIESDPSFAGARVTPPKPRIVPQRSSVQLPVFGLFRPTREDLADAICGIVRDVFRGNGHRVVANGQTYLIERAASGGDVGDSVLLSHSVEEFKETRGQTPPEARLPALLRVRLGPTINVYNPRGRSLRDVPEVQQLLGLMLECIDPDQPNGAAGGIQASMRLRRDSQRYLPIWRDAARALIATNPEPRSPHRLRDFVDGWQRRVPQSAAVGAWPQEWPALDLFFKLLVWLPELRASPEGQVYLEAVARAIAASATVSNYRSMIVFGQTPHGQQSVSSFISSVLQPLAESAVDIDEEVMPDVPRSAFPIMTIHQAKGLEFPLVFVDVGSDYKREHPLNRFKRHPTQPDGVHNLEDDLAHCTPVGASRTSRDGITRAFDDLRRLYYVAYSRPETVLILVGLNKCLEVARPLPHVATWYRQDGSWAWLLQPPGQRRRPAMPNSLPLTLI